LVESSSSILETRGCEGRVFNKHNKTTTMNEVYWECPIGFRWAWSDKDTPPADRMKAQDVLPSLQEQMIKTEENYTLVNQTDDKDRGEIHAGKPIAIQEALEEENTKDTPSFGTEDLE